MGNQTSNQCIHSPGSSKHGVSKIQVLCEVKKESTETIILEQ